MTDFDDRAAAAIRLRTATDSLTDLRDWKIAREYIRELEISGGREDSGCSDPATDASDPDEATPTRAEVRADLSSFP